jgi:6-phosphofructokinase 1
MAKRIGVLTAGGDAPGQNVCLKTVIYNAVNQGYEVIGIRKGWEGLMQLNPKDPTTQSDNAMVLTKTRVRDVDRTPGSFLHSSRLDPARVSPQLVPLFLQPDNNDDQLLDLTDHMKQAIELLGLDALVVIGDDTSLKYAARLSRENVPVVGIPKSVHNDVCGSDYSIGFSTALASGVRFVHEFRAMVGSREEIGVLEMFGRTFGLTTMMIALLSGADRVLIPEVPFDPERLAALLIEDKRNNPNNYAILLMSEAVSIDPAVTSKYSPEQLQRANPRASTREGDSFTLSGSRAIGLGAAGGGSVVTEILEKLLCQRLLFQPLTYLLRIGTPDGQDLLGATNFGTMAVNMIAAGKTGRLVAYHRGENYVDVPIDKVTERKGNIHCADFYDFKTCRAQPGILWSARI